MTPLGILFQGDYPTAEIPAVSEPALPTSEIPIYLGKPMLPAPHKTRYERPQRFASLRRHGSDAWLIAMSAAGIAAGVIGWSHGIPL